MITAPLIINQGIAVYVPALLGWENGVIRIEITHSLNMQQFNRGNCNPKQQLIWQKLERQNPQGTLFLYHSPELLKGFFNIRVEAANGSSQIQGQLKVGFTEPTSRLIVGLPYSLYPPITLS